MLMVQLALTSSSLKHFNLNLVGYNDVDWAKNVEDKKSTIGGYFFVGTNLVLWHSKKKIPYHSPPLKQIISQWEVAILSLFG